MLYQVRAKLSFFKQSRMFHIVTRSPHRRVIFLLLVLFFLCSTLPSQFILQPFTPGLDHNLGHHEQSNDQNPFEEDIWSSGDARAWPERAEKVKAAFIHAYVGYKTYAFGMDELKPLSNGGVNNLNGWGLTIIDSLDTMLLMDLRPQFLHAVHEHVAALNFTDPLQRFNKYVPFFETQIRYFGGLLSSYHLASISPYEEVRETAAILRTKAEELGEAMLPAFNTESGLPAWSVDTSSREAKPQARSQTNLAEIASNQLEYKYLSHLIASSGRPIGEAKPYFIKPDHVMDILERWQGKDMTTWAPNPPVAVKEGSEVGSKFGAKTNDKYEVELDTGLWKTDWGADTGEMYGVQVSIGALGDSAYEYLLKQYLLSGRTEKRLLNMCKWFGPTCLRQGETITALGLDLKAIDGIINHLLYLSVTRDLLYVTDAMSFQMRVTGKMEHLSCFLPATLALGAKLLDPDYPWPPPPPHLSTPSNAKRAPIPKVAQWGGNLKKTLDLHMRVARGLATTCYVLYADTPTGVGPDEVFFDAPSNDDQAPHSHIKNFTKARWRERLIEWEDGGRRGPLVGTDRWGAEVEEKVVLRGMGNGMGMNGEREQDYRIRGGAGYLLRPEAIEAMYILWRTTGDSIWRRRGWDMFEAVEKWTRTDSGYARLVSVLATENPRKTDTGMASFFLAETLKYSYLLCLDKDPVPLDRFVFNTEAHPLPMFTWSAKEAKEFGIRG